AEERRREAVLANPRRLLADAPGGVAAGRPRMRRARPVRVVPERPAGGGLACTREPELAILALVRRAQQRRDRKTRLEAREEGPRPVVERPLDVAGDHRVALRADVWHLRSRNGRRPARSGPRRRDAGGDP